MIAWKDLLQQYPLPPGSAEIETFEDVLNIDLPALHLAGIAAKRADGRLLTGSAVDLSREAARVRAYFELLERLAIFEADDRGPQHSFRVLDRGGNASDQRTTLPPFDDSDPHWRWSRSNGIAAHTDLVSAIRGAEFEIWERDQVLRSWFGEIAPRRLNTPLKIESWGGYRFEAFAFSAPESPVFVGGVFGFPNSRNQPVVFGFSAASDLETSLAKAQKEALQRMAFLWDEPLPENDPPVTGTPDFHMDWFRRPDQRYRIERWLAGDRTSQEVRPLPSSAPILSGEGFIDLSPTHLEGKVFVVQASIPEKKRLFFGMDPSWSRSTPGWEEWIHPIA